jgi:hypothetical protein
MTRRRPLVSPLVSAAVAVGLALLVAAIWYWRSRVPAAENAAIVSVRIVRRDALGMPTRPVLVRDPVRVRAIVQAIGLDGKTPTTCPPDYASAEFGLLLSGADVYGRRNVYIWSLAAAREVPTVLVVSSTGCLGGPPADADALRREVITSVWGSPIMTDGGS